ncbi:MAG: sensor histidine kinase [Oscillospiraceae bacterium]|nr:sensor histidine kinase [Oscillospiraceae bacterium]
MKLFGRYIYQRRKVIISFLLFCAVFAVSFILYHLPLEAIAYPSMICVLLGLGLIIPDFFRTKRKHESLCEIQKLTAEMIDTLPEERNIDDADYQAIIRVLRNEMTESAAIAFERYRDMVEYYTVWAHQIKTPITSMRLSLEKEDSALSRKLSSDLFQIEQYVEMVLAFLRLDSDTSDYVFREYGVDEIIEQAVAKFASEFIARKIRLNYTPSGEAVVTDDKWLSFVIEQVLSNALKYTVNGEIKIYMKEPKTLCIEDTGIGISPSDLPRVFEKGYTGYNGREDKRASGIGLYLCKRICTKLGVEINISSELDKGTLVKLDLEQYKIGKE